MGRAAYLVPILRTRPGLIKRKQILMPSQSSTPLWDDLSEKTVMRLFSDDRVIEFLILKGHLLIENALDVLIGAALKRPEFLSSRLTFHSKLSLARALGAIPDTYAGPIKALNRVRNDIAHVDGYTISLDDLLALRLDWDHATDKKIRREFDDDPTEATRTVAAMLVFKCLGMVADHELGEHRKKQ